MAARAGEVGYDRLPHFVPAGVWNAEPLEAALLAEANPLVGGKDALLVAEGEPKGQRAAQEEAALGGRSSAVHDCAGQERQPLDTCLAQAGPAGGARRGRPEAVPARVLDR